MNNDVVIYQSADGLVKMEAIVDASNETIWATQKAMAELFGVTVPNISYHFKRIFSSGELEPEMVIKEILITAQSGVRGLSEEKVKYYNLDAILSLGYRVNSVQATAFRKWATSILKQYMIKGYAVNQNAVSEQKYEDLKRALGLLENVFGQNLIMAEQQAKELFAVVKDYTYALDTLDAYDYQSLEISDTTLQEKFRATYESAMDAIQSLKEKFKESQLFGVEKDKSFHSSIGQIYQTLFSYFKGRRDGCSERYKDYPFDELFPLISQQKYNVAIKKMFLAAGLIRPVVVYNSTTSEQEIRPLNEVAEANAKEIDEDMKRDLVSMLE